VPSKPKRPGWVQWDLFEAPASPDLRPGPAVLDRAAGPAKPALDLSLGHISPHKRAGN